MSPSPESPRPEAPRRKLRLLCLHGYHGSAEVMRSQMRALFEGLESLVELVCVDAPSLAQGDFGWWHAVQDERVPAREDPGLGSAARHYKGWARSRDALIERFQRQGPFDGVLGFSQGAALTGLLVGLRASDGRPTREHPLAFRFAVLVSGFPSNDPSHGALYASRASYALPSLHLVGRADGIVPPRETRALAARFANPLVVEHDGGHVIVSTPAVRAQVRDFLEARLREVSAEALAAPREPLTEELRRRFSNELHVRPGHPPVFIWTMRDDHLVPHTHSVRFAEACEAAGVPVTFKLFAHGLHGMGLALEDRSESGAWTKFLLEWLDAHWDRRAAPP